MPIILKKSGNEFRLNFTITVGQRCVINLAPPILEFSNDELSISCSGPFTRKTGLSIAAGWAILWAVELAWMSYLEAIPLPARN